MFDYQKYKELSNLIEKEAQFVPMPGEDPAAGGGAPQGAPMPPEATGADPAAAGAPMDPAAAGAPMDPAAMGAMPPTGADPSMMAGAPMDPAAMGMPDPAAGDVSPSGEPYMKITPTQLSKLFKQFAEVFKSVLGITGAPQQQMLAQQPAQQNDTQAAEQNAKLDAILSALS